MKTAHTYISTAFYVFASVVLTIFSVAMIVAGIWHIVVEAYTDFTSALLTAAGLLVVAIAVFDVAKYLIEEEVIRSRELRSPQEVRRTLTKFMTIIMIAVSLEALVLIFNVGTTQIEALLYPALLLLSVAGLLIALGIYFRFTGHGSGSGEAKSGSGKDMSPVQR